jgi:molybdopterin-binding protein
VGEISVAIAIEGEPLASATAIVTPAAVEEFFNVFTAVFVEVPRGCCLTVAVENTSADAINVQNANLIVERVA